MKRQHADRVFSKPDGIDAKLPRFRRCSAGGDGKGRRPSCVACPPRTRRLPPTGPPCGWAFLSGRPAPRSTGAPRAGEGNGDALVAEACQSAIDVRSGRCRCPLPDRRSRTQVRGRGSDSPKRSSAARGGGSASTRGWVAATSCMRVRSRGRCRRPPHRRRHPHPAVGKGLVLDDVADQGFVGDDVPDSAHVAQYGIAGGDLGHRAAGAGVHPMRLPMRIERSSRMMKPET